MLSVAHANPDGAPWGAADPNAAQNCASCHFDQPPVTDSKAVKLYGLPKIVPPKSIAVVTLDFANEHDAKAGFMITASAGMFGPADVTHEAYGSEIRSLEPKRGSHKIRWEFIWISPDEPTAEIIFHIAVNAGNDDQSSFGDEIHFKTVTIAVK